MQPEPEIGAPVSPEPAAPPPGMVTVRVKRDDGSDVFYTVARESLAAPVGVVDTPDALDASDLRTAARVVRSSSWPIDMRANMDALADRLDAAAGVRRG